MIRVPEYSQVYCFADDIKLLCCGDSVFGNVQKDLSALRLWSHCNGLSFNSSKCCYLHIAPSTAYSVSIGVDDIVRVPCVTDLGIVISSSLKWKHHIQTKLLKARRSFGYLKHSVPYNIPSGVKYNLFKACVLSVLSYGYPAWNPEITELRKLELLSYHGLKWCFGDADYLGHLRISNSLQICYQLIERDLIFFLSIVNNRNCLKFNDLFTLMSKDVCLRAGDHKRLLVSRCKNTLTEKSFFFRSERVVNDAAGVLGLKLSWFLSQSVFKSDIRKGLLELSGA